MPADAVYLIDAACAATSTSGCWLIHVGFAISRVDEKEAKASLEFREGLGQAFRDEMAALRGSPPEGGS